MRVRHRRYGGTPKTVLAGYIAERADEWVEAWLRDIQEESTTRHYRGYPDKEELKRDTATLYHYLALWLSTGEWDPRIDPHYERIGRDRRAAGFPLSEVISAILLAKRHLWNGIMAGPILSVALEMEASKAISLFYDKAIYHTIVGYEREGGES
ncbi:MAG: RsbRD N-terminal domain-containing protein [Gemmatimonadetes bacterium]|nr:RsbRD N-terminal domain-containing protein [Gemmatimonadota bacterium]